jgi:hypothetical protein
MTRRPNQTVERMAAGGRCLRVRASWAAAIAHFYVRQPRSRQGQTGTSPLSSDRMNRIYRMVPIMGGDRMDPVHPAILSKPPGPSSRRELCTRTGLRVRSLLRYP